MTYRLTILNTSTALFLIGILLYTIFNYKILSAGEGWGLAAMLGLFGIGLKAGITDLILQYLIKSRKLLNIVGLLIVLGISIAILLGA